MSSTSLKSTELCIEGMTCDSCSLLLERKFKAIKGIRAAKVNHRTGRAHLTFEKGKHPSMDTLATIVRGAGYHLRGDSVIQPVNDGTGHQWIEIGAALIVMFAIGKLLQVFDLVSLAPSTSGALTIGGIFLIGIVAGTSSCLAVTGGLLLAVAAKYNEKHRSVTGWQKFVPLLQFNIGRVLSYFVLGGVVGWLGQSITLSAQMTGMLNIVVALVMLWLALTILQIVPKGVFPVRPPRWLSHRIADLSDNPHPLAPLSLGALTFFLPCGFTQSLQLAALASGSFSIGALIMGTFALGTLPALLGISALSATMKGRGSRWFLRLSGATVLLLALFNLQSGLALAGFNLGGGGESVAAIERAGAQEISMSVTSYSFEPSNLTIKAGVPVRWIVDGTQASGCTSVLSIPSLNLTKYLTAGENIVEFTAPSKGNLAFSCGMGMVRGNFTVL